MRTWLLLLMMAMTTTGAWASTHPDFTQGKTLYMELEYEQALFRFQKAALDASAPASDRAQALVWVAMCYAGVGDETAAKRALEDAAVLDGTIQLPREAAPTLRPWMTAAKQKAAKAKATAPAPAPAPTPAATPAPVAVTPAPAAAAPKPAPSTTTSPAQPTTPPTAQPQPAPAPATAAPADVDALALPETERPPEESFVGPALLYAGAGAATVGMLSLIVTAVAVADAQVITPPRIEEATANGQTDYANQLKAAQEQSNLVAIISGTAGGVFIVGGLALVGASVFFE